MRANFLLVGHNRRGVGGIVTHAFSGVLWLTIEMIFKYEQCSAKILRATGLL